MSCGTQVGAKEWFLRSNKGIIALRQAEYQMPWPTDHKPMRTRWVTFHEQKWVRSRERRGIGQPPFPAASSRPPTADVAVAPAPPPPSSSRSPHHPDAGTKDHGGSVGRVNGRRLAFDNK